MVCIVRGACSHVNAVPRGKGSRIITYHSVRLCYPHGHFNPTIESFVREAGFRSCCTEKSGAVSNQAGFTHGGTVRYHRLMGNVQTHVSMLGDAPPLALTFVENGR
jgi:hypothetical protein